MTSRILNSIYPVSVLIILIIVSCFNRSFMEGRAELVSISDSTLNDSSIFVGYVNQVSEDDNYKLPIIRSEVWIDGSEIKAITDSAG